MWMFRNISVVDIRRTYFTEFYVFCFCFQKSFQNIINLKLVKIFFSQAVAELVICFHNMPIVKSLTIALTHIILLLNIDILHIHILCGCSTLNICMHPYYMVD